MAPEAIDLARGLRPGSGTLVHPALPQDQLCQGSVARPGAFGQRAGVEEYGQGEKLAPPVGVPPGYPDHRRQSGLGLGRTRGSWGFLKEKELVEVRRRRSPVLALQETEELAFESERFGGNAAGFVHDPHESSQENPQVLGVVFREN
jgi:hypothetical protein